MMIGPVIDISPFLVIKQDRDLQACARVARMWDAAFSNFGMAIIIGHGVSPVLFEGLTTESNEFFSKNLEEKMLYCPGGGYGNPAGGYTPRGKESVSRSNIGQPETLDSLLPAADSVESFVYPRHPSLYCSPDHTSASPIPSATSYFDAMQQLLTVLHQISSCALELESESFFEPFFDANHPEARGSGDNGYALRLAYYPTTTLSSPSSSSSSSSSSLRYGAHTDYQTFTILRPDPSDWSAGGGDGSSSLTSFCSSFVLGGLEVFVRPVSLCGIDKDKDKDYEAGVVRTPTESRGTGEWQAVSLRDMDSADCPLVINAGDLIELWTNGRWHSPLHRVAGPRVVIAEGEGLGVERGDGDGDGEGELGGCKQSLSIPARLSIVFFSGPLDSALIEPLPLTPHPLFSLATADDGDVVDEMQVVGRVDGIHCIRGDAPTGSRKMPVRAGDHLRMKLSRSNVSSTQTFSV